MRHLVISILMAGHFVGVSHAQTAIDTPEEEPKKSNIIPDSFRGIAGVLPDINSAEFAESGTILEEDDTIVTFDLKHLRTGVLKNDLVYSQALNTFDNEKTVPAGTLMYANTYGRIYNGRVYSILPQIGWCAVQPEKKKSVCVFWGGKPKKGFWQKKKENPGRVSEYVETSKSQSQYYVDTMKVDQHRDEGTIPIIEEKVVDFGRDFEVEIRFRKFKKKRVSVTAVFSDGGEKEFPYTAMDEKLRNLSLDESGSAEFDILGKKVRLSRHDPDEKKTATFEIIR